jgi:hypothetical protein
MPTLEHSNMSRRLSTDALRERKLALEGRGRERRLALEIHLE